MCYTEQYIAIRSRMNTHVTRHYLFECDEYHPNKYKEVKMKFNLCDLIEIDDPYNPKQFKLLCSYHNMKRELALERELDLKYGVLTQSKEA